MFDSWEISPEMMRMLQLTPGNHSKVLGSEAGVQQAKVEFPASGCLGSQRVDTPEGWVKVLKSPDEITTLWGWGLQELWISLNSGGLDWTTSPPIDRTQQSDQIQFKYFIPAVI